MSATGRFTASTETRRRLRRTGHRASAALLALAVALAPPAAAQGLLDPKLPVYEPRPGVSGTIKSVGSDTMNNLMTLWAEGFRGYYPNVQVEIEGKGSSTAPPALSGGSANFGPMSREMKSSEIEDFESQHGHKPTGLATCIDMLAVYVHHDNPIAGLTLPQCDAIFSRTRRLGLPSEIVHWGQLGLEGRWGLRRVSPYGRNAASGTYGYFKENVLGKGDFKDSVKEQPGSSSVVQSIARDRFAIGYSGIGYRTADVRAVPLATAEGAEFVPPLAEFAYDGRYPLARPLLIYVDYDPDAAWDPLRSEFVRYVFSRQGQTAVVKDGYFPVNAELAAAALESVGLAASPRHSDQP